MKLLEFKTSIKLPRRIFRLNTNNHSLHNFTSNIPEKLCVSFLHVPRVCNFIITHRIHINALSERYFICVFYRFSRYCISKICLFTFLYARIINTFLHIYTIYAFILRFFFKSKRLTIAMIFILSFVEKAVRKKNNSQRK